MDLLDQYQQLCDSVYSLLSQESALLKKKQPTTKSILNEKKALLPKLEEALLKLKSVTKLSQEDKEKAQILQQKLMKIFLIDRENEKLLLELQVVDNWKPKHEKINSSRLRTLYSADKPSNNPNAD